MIELVSEGIKHTSVHILSVVFTRFPFKVNSVVSFLCLKLVRWRRPVAPPGEVGSSVAGGPPTKPPVPGANAPVMAAKFSLPC